MRTLRELQRIRRALEAIQVDLAVLQRTDNLDLISAMSTVASARLIVQNKEKWLYNEQHQCGAAQYVEDKG